MFVVNGNCVFVRIQALVLKDGVCWRCSNGKCKKKLSIREESWFSKSHLVLEQIVKLTYYWVYKCPADFVARDSSFALEVNTL